MKIDFKTPPFYLLLLVFGILALVVLVVLYFQMNDNKSSNNDLFADLAKQKGSDSSIYDNTFRLTTNVGNISLKKTDTIRKLEIKKNSLITQLEIKKRDNSISWNDLVDLTETIEELRRQQINVFEKSNLHLNTMDSLLNKSGELTRQINDLDTEISQSTNKIYSINNKPIQLSIFHFRTLDKDHNENYAHENVRTFLLDCFIQSCINEPVNIFLVFKDPNDNVIPFSTKTSLISIQKKKIFPSIEDTIYSKGSYHREINTRALGLSGRYTILIIDNQNRILAEKYIDLM